MENFFVLVSYNKGQSFNILDLNGQTIARCKSAITWQNWRDGEVVHICKPVSIAGGRFECVETGKLLKPEVGCYTLAAWGSFLNKIFNQES
jgi:hypothetical protein